MSHTAQRGMTTNAATWRLTLWRDWPDAVVDDLVPTSLPSL